VNYPVEDPTDETTVGVRTSTYTYRVQISGLFSKSYSYTYAYNGNSEFGLDFKHEKDYGLHIPSYCLSETPTIAKMVIQLFDTSQPTMLPNILVYDGPSKDDPTKVND
jgi:hypothetical protein